MTFVKIDGYKGKDRWTFIRIEGDKRKDKRTLIESERDKKKMKCLKFNLKDLLRNELVLNEIENNFLKLEREIEIVLEHFVFENDWKVYIVFIKIRKYFNNKICGMLKYFELIERYVPDSKIKGFKGFLRDFDINVWVGNIG